MVLASRRRPPPEEEEEEEEEEEGEESEDSRPSVFDVEALKRWLYREEGVRDEAATAKKVVRLVARSLQEGVSLESLARKANVSEGVVAGLRERFRLLASPSRTLTSRKDGSTKFVINGYETVVMRHAERTTVCVSSQVGCAMGCQFCATGTMGLRRNLSSADVVDQFAAACASEVGDGRAAPSNVVFMGQGEPLANYGEVTKAIDLLLEAFQLRSRAVTVSTVGVVPSMKRFTAEYPEVSLALSLHAPTQELREKIVPSAKKWPLHDLLAAVDDHLDATQRRHRHSAGGMMIEYVLLKNVNDSFENADQLASLLKGKKVMVNLIPFNPNVTAFDRGFEAPDLDHARLFGKRLIDAGLRARLRKELGADINAACGQLALVEQNSKSKSKQQQKNNAKQHTPLKDIEDLGWGRSREIKSRRRRKRHHTSDSGVVVVSATKTRGVVSSLALLLLLLAAGLGGGLVAFAYRK